MADQMADVEEPILLEEGAEGPDNATLFTGGLVFTTFGVLLVAHFVAQKVIAEMFGKGLLA